MKRVYRGLKRYGHEALRSHVLEIARHGRSRHPALDSLSAVQALLRDREVVRHDTELRFGVGPAAGLEPGDFAALEPTGTDGPKRFRLTVHEAFSGRGADLAALVAYYVPSINYGKMASSDDAEAFGATVLGRNVEDYYTHVCRLADELT